MTQKRVVPPALQKLLKIDIALTSQFCHAVEKVCAVPPAKYRKYLKLLEISCHGLPWILVWLASFWILWNPNLFEMQVNFLFGCLLDMLLVVLLKAAVRRKRPPGNHPDWFMTYGADVYSFPSGHISRAVLAYIFFSKLNPTHFLIQAFLLLWAISVGVSRVLLKRHFLLDLAGGVALGFFEAGVVSLFWISKPTAIALVAFLSEETVTLEGLQDASEVD